MPSAPVRDQFRRALPSSWRAEGARASKQIFPEWRDRLQGPVLRRFASSGSRWKSRRRLGWRAGQAGNIGAGSHLAQSAKRQLYQDGLIARDRSRGDGIADRIGVIDLQRRAFVVVADPESKVGRVKPGRML